LLFLSSGFGARLLLYSLESRYTDNSVSSAPFAPAIVVLGGGLANTGHPSKTTQLGPKGDRLYVAFQLYRAGKSPLILISGGGPPNDTPESALAKGILMTWGVPGSAILTDEKSRDTHQNALFSQRILAQKGIDRILLVTSAAHMPRAVATLQRTGLTVFPVPADYLAGSEGEGFWQTLRPSAEGLADSGNVIKEWLGIPGYRVRGWAR
jgi:uncharacterized SAM-binding protein YcdF (DUF218 family)